jgi:hypothetical protein
MMFDLVKCNDHWGFCTCNRQIYFQTKSLSNMFDMYVISGDRILEVSDIDGNRLPLKPLTGEMKLTGKCHDCQSDFKYITLLFRRGEIIFSEGT